MPILYLSGQPSKEAHYEDSIYREQRFSVLLSVIVAFGHESHLHGPLFSALMAYLMLGLWSVQAQIEAHRDPLTWSVAESLRVVRGAMRPAGGGRRRGDLVRQLQRAVKDTYVRNGSKSARNWPRKKNDHPPGLPKMREASPEEKHRAERTYERTKRE